jgi:hypothetical protein
MEQISLALKCRIVRWFKFRHVSPWSEVNFGVFQRRDCIFIRGATPFPDLTAKMQPRRSNAQILRPGLSGQN